MATEADRLIGENVARLRGSRTQQAVADAMRERGWKWSQATVWAVEQGERPLRLAESRELAHVLGCRIDDLTGAPPAVRARMDAERAIGLLAAKAEKIRDDYVAYAHEHATVTDWLDSQAGLGLIAPEDYERYGMFLRDRGPEEVLEIARQTPVLTQPGLFAPGLKGGPDGQHPEA